MNTVASVDPARRNNFDFTRLALAIAVIYSHAYVLTGGAEHGEIFHRLSGGVLEAGVLAVNGFFVISGFLIAASWERSSSVFSYLRKRIYRIYPGFIVAWLFGVFVVAPLVAEVLRYDGVWKQLAGLVLLNRMEPAGAFEANPYPGVINGSLWTISYEFRCYQLVMALGLTGILRRRGVVLGLTIGSLLLYVGSGYVQLPAVSGAMATVFGLPDRLLRLLTFFLVGVCFYKWQVKFSGGLAAAALAASALALLHPTLVTAVLPIGFSYALLWFCFCSRVRLQGWGKYGDFSYGTYLYAFPIQQLLVYWTGNSWSPLLHFAVALPLSVLAGVLSWHAVERHFLVRARKSAERVPAGGPGAVSSGCPVARAPVVSAVALAPAEDASAPK
jgi:peptidoglycan/LPS O-acetylase OafA/YrhL